MLGFADEYAFTDAKIVCLNGLSVALCMGED